jgi:hypothetical protein
MLRRHNQKNGRGVTPLLPPFLRAKRALSRALAMSANTPSEKIRPHLLTTASAPAGLSRWMLVWAAYPSASDRPLAERHWWYGPIAVVELEGWHSRFPSNAGQEVGLCRSVVKVSGYSSSLMSPTTDADHISQINTRDFRKIAGALQSRLATEALKLPRSRSNSPAATATRSRSEITGL